MSNTDTSSLISPPHYRRSLVPGTATQVHTTVVTSAENSTVQTTAVYRGLPQQQVSLPSSTTNYAVTTSSGNTINKSSSCPDSPIRRVSSSLKNSAVGFATRFFNKCRAATFTVDGATYTIVASTPENLPKRDDLSCSGGSTSSSNTNTGCPFQTGSSGGGGASSNNQQQHQHSTSDRGFASCSTNTQIAGSREGAGGGNNTCDFSKITSPSSGDNTQEYNSSSNSNNISITNNSIASTINGQVARHGALTIVRRSNSRKSFSQFESQHLHSQVSTPTSSSAHQGSLGDSLAKASNILHDNRVNEATNTNPVPPSSQHLPSIQTPTYSTQQHSTSNTAQILKMLPTSPNSGNDTLPSTNDMEHPMEDTTSTVASGLTITSSPTDLATDNLPAVDTPDACDKAALRLRSLLRMLNAGEIQADVLQKNLHYAARVLEAVFLDESKSPTSGKSKLRQNSCSSIECEDCGEINNFEELCLGQGNKQDIKDERCYGDCKNVECNQHKHSTHSSLDPTAKTNENNNINTSCSLLGNEEESEKQATDGKFPTQNATDNQTSIDSRTKGVCTAPQTHSGPTGPPENAENVKDTETSATEVEKDPSKEDKTNTCSSTIKTSTLPSSENTNNSSVSSSSCSNKATIQRQKRLRTPVWARTITTDKTYIKFI